MTSDGRERGRKLRDEIYAAYERDQEVRRPRRLRPSAIGHQCMRFLWLDLRWASALEIFNGQKLRLFETGHSQEDRLVADIRRLGVHVVTRDQDDPSKQIGFELFDGHMAGFIDFAASEVPHAGSEWVIGECKSHNTKSFAKLEKEGVETSKPEHYAQFQTYLHAFGLKEALYLAVNKDTDHLYAEVLERDDRYIERLMAKGEQAIFGYRAAPKISKTGDFFVCKMCKARAVCQEGKLPERNCRTCTHVRPERGGKAVWRCGLHGHELSLDDQQAGCEDHRYQRDMVAGEMSEGGEAVDPTYVRSDGATWTDRGPAHDHAETKPEMAASE